MQQGQELGVNGRLQSAAAGHGDVFHDRGGQALREVVSAAEDVAAERGRQRRGHAAQGEQRAGQVVLHRGGDGNRLAGADHPILIAQRQVQRDRGFVEDVRIERISDRVQLVQRLLGQVGHAVAVGVRAERIRVDQRGQRLVDAQRIGVGGGKGPAAQPFAGVAVAVVIAPVLVAHFLAVGQAVAVCVAQVRPRAQPDLVQVAQAVHVRVIGKRRDARPAVRHTHGPNLQFISVAEAVVIAVPAGAAVALVKAVVRVIAPLSAADQPVAVVVQRVRELHRATPIEAVEVVQAGRHDVQHKRLAHQRIVVAADRLVQAEGEVEGRDEGLIDGPTFHAGEGIGAAHVHRQGDVDPGGHLHVNGWRNRIDPLVHPVAQVGVMALHFPIGAHVAPPNRHIGLIQRQRVTERGRAQVAGGPVFRQVDNRARVARVIVGDRGGHRQRHPRRPSRLQPSRRVQQGQVEAARFHIAVHSQLKVIDGLGQRLGHPAADGEIVAQQGQDQVNHADDGHQDRAHHGQRDNKHHHGDNSGGNRLRQHGVKGDASRRRAAGHGGIDEDAPDNADGDHQSDYPGDLGSLAHFPCAQGHAAQGGQLAGGAIHRAHHPVHIAHRQQRGHHAQVAGDRAYHHRGGDARPRIAGEIGCNQEVGGHRHRGHNGDSRRHCQPEAEPARLPPCLKLSQQRP